MKSQDEHDDAVSVPQLGVTEDAQGKLHKVKGDDLRDQAPYPWCHGAPTVADCVARGYCAKNPGCGD